MLGGGVHEVVEHRQDHPALILERFVLRLVLLFAVSILIFGGLEALPGD
ncbi:ABC transporter permease, partial [Rhizobium ruizarguesonis]